jgi:hypothetical protein
MSRSLSHQSLKRQRRTQSKGSRRVLRWRFLKLRFLAESRGLAPRFFRLAAKNMAINTSGRDVNNAIFARLPRPQFAAFGFGLGKLATCWLLSSSADRSMSVLLSSEPKVPWGKPTGLICSKSATSKALQARMTDTLLVRHPLPILSIEFQKTIVVKIPANLGAHTR